MLRLAPMSDEHFAAYLEAAVPVCSMQRTGERFRNGRRGGAKRLPETQKPGT
jgi:hypothetical protein